MKNVSAIQAHIDLLTALYRSEHTGESPIMILFRGRKPTPEEFIELIARIISDDHLDVA